MTVPLPAPSTIAFIVDRPSTNTLIAAIAMALVGWALHIRAEWATSAPRAEPRGDARPEPLPGHTSLEPPAVVAVLTNDYEIPNSAVTATAIDLAARRWIRFSTVDDELVVVTRGSGDGGDSLRPYEQQVLNHLAGRAFHDVASAGTLATSHHRLDRRWWVRFRRSVATHSSQLGLSSRRYTAIELAPVAACVAIGLIATWLAVRDGDDVAVADSWRSRTIWLVTIAALLTLAWRTADRVVEADQRPSDLGLERTNEWMAYRRRLRERIPEHASVIAPSAQQHALGYASVMGVASQVLDQLPVAPEAPRRAWSEAGDVPHVVKVRYPIRPGYGQSPIKLAVVGAVVFLAARWLRGFFGRVSDGEALESLLDNVPGQIDLIETIARVLEVLCVFPMIWAVWAVIAGAVDSVATRERIGLVVRTRRPVDVIPVAGIIKPFAERDRFSTYLAVDDGRHATVTAWLANERTAAPQGAQARVRATPLLGYVRSSEPVGTATRSAPSSDST